MVNTFIKSLVFYRINSQQIGSYFVFHNFCPLHASLCLLSTGDDLSKSYSLIKQNNKKKNLDINSLAWPL